MLGASDPRPSSRGRMAVDRQTNIHVSSCKRPRPSPGVVGWRRSRSTVSARNSHKPQSFSSICYPAESCAVFPDSCMYLILANFGRRKACRRWRHRWWSPWPCVEMAVREKMPVDILKNQKNFLTNIVHELTIALMLISGRSLAFLPRVQQDTL